MPVKRKRYVKNMDKMWKMYDKSMTSLMAPMCGRLLMVFIHGKLRMDDIHGRLHMVDYIRHLCRHVNDVRELCKCMHGCYMCNKYMILYKW
mgnify:CR=1 FL=1